ncbi:MAG TPA: hypothetical protein VGJ70_12580, partial [Solirubrobacteraceae bacterium]
MPALWLDIDAVARRFGARLSRCLSDDVPGAAADVTRNPFDLAPERVWLLESADAGRARLAAATLAAMPGVEWVEPNAVRTPADDSPAGRSGATAASRATGAGRLGAPAPPPGFPDDPLFQDGRQWGLDNRGGDGPYGGSRAADIRAVEAWTLSRGGDDVRLAIADTGIDPGHPDLNVALSRGSRIEQGINVT